MENFFGNLFVIGGAEDKSKGSRILKELLRITTERKGPIYIIGAATEDPEEKKVIYFQTFKSLGFDNTKAIYVRNREEANDVNLVGDMQNASCIFFTGGDQLKITSLIGGTYFYKVLTECYQEGIFIAGTSAGASCLCKTMIVSGIEETPPIKCTIKMAPGLGLIDGVIIDQHFSQRGRIGRLINAVCQNPGIVGIGIDEDTSLIFEGKSTFRVFGTGSVTIVDGSGISALNVSEARPDDVLAISDIKIHILPEGCTFDLLTRRPILKNTHEVDKNENS